MTINVHRMPRTSSNGDCFSLTQHNELDGKVKTMNEHRKQMFNQIKQHINETKDANDVAIAGDCDQSIASKEIDKFHEDVGVYEINYKYDNIEKYELGKTNKNGSNLIL